MQRRALLLTAAALMVGAVSVRAQATDFSGTWTPVVDPNAAGGGGGRGGQAGPITITQDAKMMTITRTTQNGETKTVYNLDGSDSKNMQQGRVGATEVVSHAKWDGAKLVVSSERDMGGTKVTVSVTYALEGGNLVQTTMQPGRDGGAPTPRVVTYKKG